MFTETEPEFKGLSTQNVLSVPVASVAGLESIIGNKVQITTTAVDKVADKMADHDIIFLEPVLSFATPLLQPGDRCIMAIALESSAFMVFLTQVFIQTHASFLSR